MWVERPCSVQGRQVPATIPRKSVTRRSLSPKDRGSRSHREKEVSLENNNSISIATTKLGWCKLNPSRDNSPCFRGVFTWIVSAKLCTTYTHEDGSKHPNYSIPIYQLPLGVCVSSMFELLAPLRADIFEVIEMWRVTIDTNIKRFDGPKLCTV